MPTDSADANRIPLDKLAEAVALARSIRESSDAETFRQLQKLADDAVEVDQRIRKRVQALMKRATPLGPNDAQKACDQYNRTLIDHETHCRLIMNTREDGTQFPINGGTQDLSVEHFEKELDQPNTIALHIEPEDEGKDGGMVILAHAGITVDDLRMFRKRAEQLYDGANFHGDNVFSDISHAQRLTFNEMLLKGGISYIELSTNGPITTKALTRLMMQEVLKIEEERGAQWDTFASHSLIHSGFPRKRRTNTTGNDDMLRVYRSKSMPLVATLLEETRKLLLHDDIVSQHDLQDLAQKDEQDEQRHVMAHSEFGLYMGSLKPWRAEAKD
jgi:hypothetical protein